MSKPKGNPSFEVKATPSVIAGVLSDLVSGMKVIAIAMKHNISASIVSNIRVQHPLFFPRTSGRKKKDS